jgi:hypothetical protein
MEERIKRSKNAGRIQGRTGHSRNATLVAGVFTISHKNVKNGPFGGVLRAFRMVEEAF